MDNKYLKYILFIFGTVRLYHPVPKYSVPKRKNGMTSGTELTSMVQIVQHAVMKISLKITFPKLVLASMIMSRGRRLKSHWMGMES
jgi:hypothetical protein